MGAEGLVLCIGEEGHMAVEVASGGRCCPFSSETSQEDSCSDPGTLVDSTGTLCGPCVDISFGSGDLIFSPDKSKTIKGNALVDAAFPLPLPPTSKVKTGVSLSQAPSSANPTFASLSTTILLI